MMDNSCKVRGCFVHNLSFRHEAEFHPRFDHKQSPGFSGGLYSQQ